MILKLKETNRLPEKTFRWLGVNELNISEEIPDIKPFKTVELTGDGKKDLEITNQLCQIEDIPPTGMGAEAVDFINTHKNRELAITVPKGKKITEPVMLSYLLDQTDPALAEKITICAKEDSELTLVVTCQGEEGTALFHGSLIYLKAEKNAVIKLIQVQLLPDTGLYFSNIGAECKDGAKICITQCEMGSRYAISGIMADLRGEESQLSVDTIYFGDRERSFDFNYVANHYGKNSKSDMKVNGALLNKSHKIFRGTIDFKPGASGAEGAEEEYTLLFDKTIKNVSVPLILCQEEDVSGKHASNSGKLEEEQLFYMMSRGLSEAESKKMMLEAWFHPAVQNIPSQELREQVYGYVKERFNYDESI